MLQIDDIILRLYSFWIGVSAGDCVAFSSVELLVVGDEEDPSLLLLLPVLPVPLPNDERDELRNNALRLNSRLIPRREGIKRSAAPLLLLGVPILLFLLLLVLLLFTGSDPDLWYNFVGVIHDAAKRLLLLVERLALIFPCAAAIVVAVDDGVPTVAPTVFGGYLKMVGDGVIRGFLL